MFRLWTPTKSKPQYWFSCEDLELREPILKKFVKIKDGKFTFNISRKATLGIYWRIPEGVYYGIKRYYLAVGINGWFYWLDDEIRDEVPLTIFYVHKSRASDPKSWKLLGNPTDDASWQWFFNFVRYLATQRDFEARAKFRTLANKLSKEVEENLDLVCKGCELIENYAETNNLPEYLEYDQNVQYSCYHCDECEFKKFKMYTKGFLWRCYHGAWLKELKEVAILLLLSSKHGSKPPFKLSELPKDIFAFILEKAHGKINIIQEEGERFPEGFN